MPRTEIATSRAAISKIQKDFERIKSIMLNTSNEVSLLRASNETDSSRQGNNIRNNNSDSKFNGLVVSEPLSSNANQYNPPQQQQQLTIAATTATTVNPERKYLNLRILTITV